jgi:hypothetical protein
MLIVGLFLQSFFIFRQFVFRGVIASGFGVTDAFTISWKVLDASLADFFFAFGVSSAS